MPCSDTYFLNVGARVSLKVANKGSIRGKKNCENGGVRQKNLKHS